MPPNTLFLSRWLSDSASDFHVGSLLGFLQICCLWRWQPLLWFQLQCCCQGLLHVRQGDVDGGDLDEVFKQWSSSLVGLLKRYSGGENGEFLIGCKLESQRVGEYESFVDLEDIAGKRPSRSSSEKTSQFGASKFERATSTDGEQNDE